MQIVILKKLRLVKFPEAVIAKPFAPVGNAKFVYSRRFSIICIIGALLFSLAAPAQLAPQSAKKPVLIRDTDIAEDRKPEPEPPKDPDPARSRENLNIGNTYLKRRNYPAAISRYIEAIEWQTDSIPAHEALARAYEKSGDFAGAIRILEDVIEKNPDSSKNKGFRSKIAGLGKKLK